jgi:uncharacterized protein (UPF0332 family)
LKPRDLLDTAILLVNSRRNKPRQSDLKRAASTIYYALFHELARSCANCVIGTAKKGRTNRAWRQVYRSLDHGFAKSQCQHGKINSFPQGVQDFANAFTAMQIKRHSVDYDPFAKVYKSEVMIDYASAETAIASFSACAAKDKKAFVAWVLLKDRT